MRDTVMAGAIIGFLSDIIKLLFNYIFYRIGVIRMFFWQIAATRFISREDLYKPSAFIIGGVVDITATAMLGVLFIYFLRLTGRDYIWVKGAGFGLIVWVGLFGSVLAKATEQELPTDPNTIIITALAHLIFGLSLAFFSRRIYRPAELK